MPHLLLDAKDVLHVVTQLVGDHVSLGELCVAAAKPF